MLIAEDRLRCLQTVKLPFSPLDGTKRKSVHSGDLNNRNRVDSIADVTVFGRDTNGQTTGGASNTVPGGTTLGTAVGSILSLIHI